ncbi:alpha-hydroxy-acid oxidizing protein [Cnuibacter sp. UC19_7]|uniref:alpha-hydroxy-acid oxidizing protein n=1 Tax=Cnuibacter sp. UC19_7 TaxID=3350166 RepID=UPI0036721D64
MSTDAPSPSGSRGISREAQSSIFRAGISGTRPRVPVDPARLARAAQRALSTEAYAYLAGGAGSERTQAGNRRAFERWQVWPRPLRDVSSRDLSTTLFGRRMPSPLVLAPLGVMELAHPEADLAVARAAAEAGVPAVLSGQASFPMEESAAAAPDAPRMFQLYWSASDELNESLVRRAEVCGCAAIVVTLDTHLLGWRTRDLDLGYLPFTRGLGIAQYTSDPVFQRMVAERTRVAGPSDAPPVRMTARTVAAGITIARKGRRITGGGLRESLRSPLPRAAVETFLDVFSTPALTWERLARIRSWTSLPVILKGIVHPDDAERAVDEGYDGVWVSNHGGRQVDRSVPTLDVLPDIAARVAERTPVIVDSGVRSGADVAVALALGADLVALGRPYAYGLAVAGEEGVAEVIRNVLAELDITLGLSGHAAVSELGPSSLRRAD